MIIMTLPDISVAKMRKDFEKIFNMHKKIDCTIIRYANAGSGDFFDETGDQSTEKIIAEISIQGTPDSIERLRQGIEMPKGALQCYIKHDVHLLPSDLIDIDGRYFKINNLKDGIKNGDTIFQEFNLEYSSHPPYQE